MGKEMGHNPIVISPSRSQRNESFQAHHPHFPGIARKWM